MGFLSRSFRPVWSNEETNYAPTGGEEESVAREGVEKGYVYADGEAAELQ